MLTNAVTAEISEPVSSERASMSLRCKPSGPPADPDGNDLMAALTKPSDTVRGGTVVIVDFGLCDGVCRLEMSKFFE